MGNQSITPLNSFDQPYNLYSHFHHWREMPDCLGVNIWDTLQNMEKINQAYLGLGGSLPSPFMTISFIGLPTLPDLGLTDLGLVDVFKHELISSFVNE